MKNAEIVVNYHDPDVLKKVKNGIAKRYDVRLVGAPSQASAMELLLPLGRKVGLIVGTNEVIIRADQDRH